MARREDVPATEFEVIHFKIEELFEHYLPELTEWQSMFVQQAFGKMKDENQRFTLTEMRKIIEIYEDAKTPDEEFPSA